MYTSQTMQWDWTPLTALFDEPTHVPDNCRYSQAPGYRPILRETQEMSYTRCHDFLLLFIVV